METCNSSEFISCLEKITGEEGIIPDPYFEGGESTQQLIKDS